MLPSSRTSDIKRAQRESFLFREYSKMFVSLLNENPELSGLMLNRVDVSSEKGMVVLFFYIPEGKLAFEEKLATLKLYKPSFRKALSQLKQSRYTPDITFRYDEQFEKQLHVEHLLDKVKAEDAE